VVELTKDLRRAAVLIASLDRDLADRLLDQMDAQQAAAVRSAVLMLTRVEPGEELAVIRDFLRKQDAPVATSDPAAPRSAESARRERDCLAARNDSTAPSPLESASERLIADCLCEELPQTIAIALGQLSTQRASEVVSYLPATLQTQVLERLVEDIPSAHPPLTEIRDEFQIWLTHQIERSLHRAELATRLAAILEATHAGARECILENVSQTDARLAKELQHRMAGTA
jgi:flagellar motor switch protein FliG